MSTISESIAEWVQATDYGDIPQEVLNIAKRCILDFVGVTLAGTREPTAQIIKHYLNDVRGKEEATAIGLGIKTLCTEAAFANGVIGHCLDYEDFIHPMPGAGGPHITAVVFPAALAIAEKENRTGKELLEAHILGCEVTHRLGRAVEPDHFLTGWHNTETEGIFGAAVAASKLLQLDFDKMTYALGITGSEASGLRENFGTMAKPFHAGQANAKGVRAALLAKLGFTSAKTIFEGKSGFFNVLCKRVRPDEVTDKLGRPFRLPEVKLKLYPCCGGSHCGIEATLDLVKQYDIRAEDVEGVTVECPPVVSEALIYDKPTTALEGKFSMQFPLALAITDRKVTLEQFTDDKIKEPLIVSLMGRIKRITNSELAVSDSPAQPAIVGIKLKGGKNIVKQVDFPRGTPQNHLSDEELFGKYKNCAKVVLPEKEADEAQQLIMNLEQLDDISRLSNIIKG